MDGQMACAVCGRSVSGRYREVTGIEEVRLQGGANAITRRKLTGRYFCDACVAEMRAGLEPNMPRLFS
jgi:hypothetical protein